MLVEDNETGPKTGGRGGRMQAIYNLGKLSTGVLEAKSLCRCSRRCQHLVFDSGGQEQQL